MKLIETPIKGLVVLEPRVFTDNRGYFFESYNEDNLRQLGIDTKFVQDNESSSEYGTVRGLHYQLDPHAQCKLVRVISGRVFDVAVDLRKDSETFGQWFGVELTGENKKQLYIPRGFAHGFSVLSENAVFAYKCDNLYAPQSERGIAWDDPALNIDWGVGRDQAIVSAKDLKNPQFDKAEMNFSIETV
ncbi:dTDP-4-dehydrorhamnose 3,5-epimerase [Puteibacter caeruleilacunae]|nr:dTDP-4-dehydrorhamnose 3,5-epimerase [Puteibacter caeruleilacunae]